MQYKVLAVDDNPINLKLLSRALINSHYQIFTAASGKEALKTAFQSKPDIILLDIMMPDMDGYEVCRKLQQREETRYIPVIFLSAKNESVDKARGLAVGAVDYLTKPFDPMEINARVRTHLALRKNIIEVLRQNDEMRQQIRHLKDKLKTIRSDTRIHQFLDSLNGTIIEMNEPSFSLRALVKSSKEPVVSGILPVYADDERLILLLVSSFEKNYPALSLRLMLQNYVTGYFRNSNSAGRLALDVLRTVLHDLVDVFNPQKFDVALTFSLTVVEFAGGQLWYGGVNQPPPRVWLPDGWDDAAHTTVLDGEFRYSGLINGRRMDLPPESKVCFYRRGAEEFDFSLYNAVFAKPLKSHRTNFAEAWQAVKKEIPEDTIDNLAVVLQLEPAPLKP